MPKLRAALLNQQHAASQLAARKKAAEREKARQGDIRAKAAGVGKGRKKAKRAERRAERRGEGVDGVDGDEGGVDVRGGQSQRGIPQDGDGAGPSAPSAPFAVLGGPAGSNSGPSKLEDNHADDIALAGAGAESASTSTNKDKDPGIADSKGKGKGKAQANAQPSGPGRIIPFDPTDTLLLLGEANFSFSLSVVVSHKFPASRMLTTSYDPEPICYRKYPDGEANVAALRRRGVRVEFGVDAGDLARCKSVGKGGGWSRVVFNFPHAGAGITDQDRNILSNQTLLLRTFRSVAPFLSEGPSALPTKPGKGKGKGKAGGRGGKRKRGSASDDEDDVGGVEDGDEDAGSDGIEWDDDDASLALALGSSGDGNGGNGNGNFSSGASRPWPPTPPSRAGSILITLLDQPPYTHWDIRGLALRPPPFCPGTRLPQPRYRVVRSWEFEPDAYPGYAHRRTIGFKEGVSKRGNEEIVGRKGRARTWEFERV